MLAAQPPSEVLLERPRVPAPAVVLVIPNEDLASCSGGRDRESELVAVARIGEEQEGVKRHVEAGELWRGAQRSVVADDPLG